MLHLYILSLKQGATTYGLWAESGLPSNLIWPRKLACQWQFGHGESSSSWVVLSSEQAGLIPPTVLKKLPPPASKHLLLATVGVRPICYTLAVS